MKLIITSALLVLLLYSCSPTKVAQISSEQLTAGMNGFVFENDTVKITYRFWDNKGRMEYDVYNKLDQPIYVDWKTSAFIPNDKMVSYYRDETNAEMVSSSYYVFGKYSGASSTAAKSKATHQERIAVIPPQAMITQKDYSLIKKFADIPMGGDFNKGNSPLVFRNYIVLATNEKFEGKSSHINNTFYISSIKKEKGDKYEKQKSQHAFFVADKYASTYK